MTKRLNSVLLFLAYPSIIFVGMDNEARRSVSHLTSHFLSFPVSEKEVHFLVPLWSFLGGLVASNLSHEYQSICDQNYVKNRNIELNAK